MQLHQHERIVHIFPNFEENHRRRAVIVVHISEFRGKSSSSRRRRRHISEFRGKSTWHPRGRAVVRAMLFLEVWATTTARGSSGTELYDDVVAVMSLSKKG